MVHEDKIDYSINGFGIFVIILGEQIKVIDLKGKTASYFTTKMDLFGKNM